MDTQSPKGAGDWTDHAADAGTDVAGTRLPARILDEIARARGAVPIEPRMVLYRGGHMYAGVEDSAHLGYLRQRLLAVANAEEGDRRRAVLAFLALQTREGTTAAINTYDSQVLTWGTGFSGRGYLPRVLSRAVTSERVRAALHESGVRFRARGLYDVVDLDLGLVVTGGIRALETLRSATPLLHLLIDLARSPKTRDAVTDAQLTTFLEGSGAVTGGHAIATQALFNLVAHLRHWAPGYATGCVEWAASQAPGPPSMERDLRLSALVGRYFYGRARRAQWLPDWSQFRIYFTRHMLDDGLDATREPFIQADAPPDDDPFATAPLSMPTRPTSPAAQGVILRSPLLSSSKEISAVAAGKADPLRRGSRGLAVLALQKAFLSMGVQIPGGADGIFGPGLESVVRGFQRAYHLPADGIAGPATLHALDAALESKG